MNDCFAGLEEDVRQYRPALAPIAARATKMGTCLRESLRALRIESMEDAIVSHGWFARAMQSQNRSLRGDSFRL